jgi:lipopolysaccharide/colanic/teichoic acid biosynthesis glycosyltransferase
MPAPTYGRYSGPSATPVSYAALPEASPVYERFKRGFDVAFAVLLLVLSLPAWLAAAAAIRLTSPGPLLFRQVRCGKDGRQFVCFKFRTMVKDADRYAEAVRCLNEMSGPVFKCRNDPRITPVGRWLRRASIDELPQLINVIRGDMSIVGPRPPLPREVAQYTPHQGLRLAVKPGLTCLWQISGRNLIDFDDWVALDIEYVVHRSVLVDLGIIMRTIPAVLSCRGAA